MGGLERLPAGEPNNSPPSPADDGDGPVLTKAPEENGPVAQV